MSNSVHFTLTIYYHFCVCSRVERRYAENTTSQAHSPSHSSPLAFSPPPPVLGYAGTRLLHRCRNPQVRRLRGAAALLRCRHLLLLPPAGRCQAQEGADLPLRAAAGGPAHGVQLERDTRGADAQLPPAGERGAAGARGEGGAREEDPNTAGRVGAVAERDRAVEDRNGELGADGWDIGSGQAEEDCEGAGRDQSAAACGWPQGPWPYLAEFCFY